MKLTVTQLKRIIKEEVQNIDPRAVGAARVAAGTAAGDRAWTNPKSRGKPEQWNLVGATEYYDALVAFARARDKVLTADQVLEDDKRDEIRADIERIVNEFISKNKLK